MKFWDLKSKMNSSSADLFIYGAILSGSKWDEADVTLMDFKQELDSLPDTTKTLNLYVNSPGGSVYATIAMMNQLERLKSKMTIDAYVDGIAASAASFLIMKADNLYMYTNSFLMIHKPMSTLWGANSVDCREMADWLDKTEANSCIPAYLGKGTSAMTEEKVKQLLDGKDNWLTAEETAELFDVTIIQETKNAVACADIDMLGSYENVPEQVKQLIPDKSSHSQKNQNLVMSAEEKALREQILADSKVNQLYLKTIL
ncbi:head maturation protease, ClpP-related [Rummeliibacillus stabekisii]|uniref:ATP-dependent Clp protease proteolytic subunit n=1 Tax=Rummeliibacillus stabekisii TaxID=241244 RepID=A0A143HBY2_9BACL|nr:head maturation protease, ClpP-related [Rummeliibacillus stabekisii]AMW99212.1 hypothetical protein ATY39_06880 [Rummeliibacillus stabekisii]